MDNHSTSVLAATGQPLFSAREREVLVHLASGLTDKEIALALKIRPRTVERYIENLRHKIHARNRVQLITKAFEAGMLANGAPQVQAAKEKLVAR